MRKTLIAMIAATVLLTGCQVQDTQSKTKWEGPPYRLTIGTQPVKLITTGVSLPDIYFTANPEGVERRANLVMRIDTKGLKKPAKAPDEILMRPTDIGGAKGQLPAPYLEDSSTELSKMLAFYGLKGNVTVNVALVQSSVMMSADDEHVDSHRLSAWVPIVVSIKNPRPKG